MAWPAPEIAEKIASGLMGFLNEITPKKVVKPSYN